MFRYLVVILLSGFGFLSKGQNLIFNGGFENPLPPSTCSYALYDNHTIPGWYTPSFGTPDIYCYCNPPPTNGGMSIPYTRGYQYSHSGIAMSGGVIYPGLEYLTTHLISPLDSNQTYCLEFYINKGNDLGQLILSIDRIGIYFSKDSIHYSALEILPYAPQIETSDGVFYEDTLGWTKVQLQYLAQGGEKYMTIGNFYPDSLTHTNPPNPDIIYGAYYFFDDFSLVECKGNAIEENPALKAINIYPNPASNLFNIQYNFTIVNTVFELYSIDGKKLDSVQLQGQSGLYTYSTDNLADGVYLYSVKGSNGIIASGKLVLIK